MWRRYGAPMIDPTVLRGFSDANGSWKIICISRRSARSSPPCAWVMSWPSNSIVPSVASYRRITTRASVDFPHPVSPTSPSVSPLIDLQVDAVHRVDVADPLLEQDPPRDREDFRRPSIRTSGVRSDVAGSGWGRSVTSTLTCEPSPVPGRCAPCPRAGGGTRDAWCPSDGRSSGTSRPALVEDVRAARVERRTPAARRSGTAGGPGSGAGAPSRRSRSAAGSTRAGPTCTGDVRLVVDVAAVARLDDLARRTSPGCGRSARPRRRGRA